MRGALRCVDRLCDGEKWGAVGGGAAEPGQLAAVPVPIWTNLRFSHPNDNTRFAMLDNNGRRVNADHGNNGPTVQAATVDGVFRGAFAIAFECSYKWGWAGMKLFNADYYNPASGLPYGGEQPDGKKFLTTANNNSNNMLAVWYWDGESSHTPVDEGGKSSGVHWLRRDKQNRVYFGYGASLGDQPAWTLVEANWPDDLVAYTRLQSPSWVRLLHIVREAVE